ncbi:unnamed protein product [Cunninghamella blakesleeana]
MSLADILSKLPKLYKNTDINKESWYLVASVIMTTLNQPQDISQVYYQVVQTTSTFGNNEEAHKAFVLRIKEGILKSSPIIGIPKVINALKEFHSTIPVAIQEQLPTTSSRKVENWEDIVHQHERGKELFNRIYGRYANKVQSSLHDSYPDLAQVCDNVYGNILSHSEIIHPLDTSFILMASLMVQNLPSQLKGHYIGAMHNGATKEQFLLLQSIVEKMCSYYNTTFLPLPIRNSENV